MRFSKIKIAKNITAEKGLKEINLTSKPFGSTVALVGTNGAGKSRILNLIENYLKNITAIDILEDYIVDIPDILKIGALQQNLDAAKTQYSQYLRSQPDEKRKKAHEKDLNTKLNGFIKRIKSLGRTYIKIIDNDELKTIKESIQDMEFEQILSNSHFERLVSSPDAMLQEIEKNPHQSYLLNEIKAFNSQNTIQYLIQLTKGLITDKFNLYLQNEEDLNKIKTEITKKDSHKLFTKFQNYVKQFLGKEFSYRANPQKDIVNSQLYYDGQPFNLSNFSPGQKTLFAYAVLFFYLDVNSKANMKDSIIIVDEPEKHLHPEAQIALINALKRIVADSGQLWIATHSVHILSHLEYDEIFMVKDGEIIPPSRTTPGKSFVELMGLDEHIEELTTFINSASEWAYANFMRQCFKSPEVIFGNSPNDPQFQLFNQFVKDLGSFNLLDFGAGKGRTGYTIQEDEELKEKISYYAYAFEPNENELNLLNLVPNIKNLYLSTKDIKDNQFKCILLCNVLHEIHPIEWISNFSDIQRILKPDGYLLIVEDKFLPKGENAHECGYLVLGTPELNMLFNISESDEILELNLTDARYKDRIVFCAIRKEQINITKESVINSIKELKSASYLNLKKLRKQPKDINQGRLYANQTQLYINSQIALEDLKK